MNRPFMIRFPYRGRSCYANVYMHNASPREFHVHIIDPNLHSGLPLKIILRLVEGKLLVTEPRNLSKIVLSMIAEEIERKRL